MLCIMHQAQPTERLALLRAAIFRGEIAGWDDEGSATGFGRTFATLEELWAVQAEERADYYAANTRFWEDGGYGGADEDESMIGDDGSDQDVADSSRFLDRLLAVGAEAVHALDVGAGVGRVTQRLLLPRCASVHLVEGSQRWSDASRKRLGAAPVTFTICKLEDYSPPVQAFGLIWVQWVLQYLIDADAIVLLRRLGQGLSPSGLLVLKENAPAASGAAESLFQVMTPSGGLGCQRFEVTRPEAHHRLLFQHAELELLEQEPSPCTETTFWVLRKRQSV